MGEQKRRATPRYRYYQKVQIQSETSVATGYAQDLALGGVGPTLGLPVQPVVPYRRF